MQGSAQKMLQRAKEMQDRVSKEIAAIRVEASTGGGMVRVKMDGNKAVLAVVIEPEAAEDLEMLQDMIQGACNEAANRVDEQAKAMISKMMGGVVRLGLPLPLPPNLLR